jgi:hypothetical protein
VHDLTIEHRGLQLQPCERADQWLEFLSPIIAALGQQADARALDAREQAIAIELHLVQPGVASWRRVNERGELQMDEGWKCTLPRTRDG